MSKAMTEEAGKMLDRDELESELKFSVDADLFRELGERLVGKPHIALGELVKNSYDADATRVDLEIKEDQIVIEDNGHGMTFEEFKDFWMRVGSHHKAEKRVSRNFNRKMTGEKGIGRLSVQFLARELELKTVSENNPNEELNVFVNWDEAVEAEALTEAEAQYNREKRGIEFPGNQKSGTKIVLKNLNQNWSEEDIVELTKEVWRLQPPFKDPERVKKKKYAFDVNLESPDEEAVEKFEEHMKNILKIWTAKLHGKLVNPEDKSKSGRKIKIHLEFDDGEEIQDEFVQDGCYINNLDFEIRIFQLKNRQPHGIAVNAAREYFNEFGGVYVYDGGFRMPYYGPEHDWLDVEMDYSHRRTKSDLLPDDLQKGALQYLPSTSQLFGVVNVNTAEDQQIARKHNMDKSGKFLNIQVSRDRLVDNEAFNDLKDIIRWAIDFYSAQRRKRELNIGGDSNEEESVSKKFERVDEVLEHHEDNIPDSTYEELETQVNEAIEVSESKEETLKQRTGLLGSLATAGISALAYEHEARKRFKSLKKKADNLLEVSIDNKEIENDIKSLAEEIKDWMENAKNTRQMFSFLLEEENREERENYQAEVLIKEVLKDVKTFLRNIKVDTDDIDEGLELPKGSYAEWTSIFQNVLINASNAMLDSEDRKIKIHSKQEGNQRKIIIQDTGCGVDLDNSEELFEPFERKLDISEERRELGAGGSGLGLTIVKMLANELNCRVEFISPEDDFSTAFKLEWSVKND